MDYREVDGTREFVCRLAHGADWRGEIESLAREEDVASAFFVALGAVTEATIYFYDQDTTTYEPVTFEEPFEVAACVGNISLLEDEPFAHAHVVLSRADGSTVAGHLDTATVFAGECYVRAFDVPLERAHDATTDLDLWDFDAA